jgi:hypothetical protein
MNHRSDGRGGGQLGRQQWCRHDPTTHHHRRIGVRRPRRGRLRHRLGQCHRPQLRGGGPGRAGPVQLHHGVIRKALLLGDHVDDHRGWGGSRSGTVRAPALAGQPIPAVPESPQRIGAALLERARIAIAHSARHRIQPVIQRGGVMTEQLAIDIGHAAAMLIEHRHMTTPAR